MKKIKKPLISHNLAFHRTEWRYQKTLEYASLCWRSIWEESWFQKKMFGTPEREYNVSGHCGPIHEIRIDKAFNIGRIPKNWQLLVIILFWAFQSPSETVENIIMTLSSTPGERSDKLVIMIKETSIKLIPWARPYMSQSVNA